MVESDDEFVGLCLPGEEPYNTYSTLFHHSPPRASTSSFFNCSVDFSSNDGSISFDVNVDTSSSYCTCSGADVCGICRFSAPDVFSSSFRFGPISVNLSSRVSFRRRGFRDHNKREERLTSLRGIVKTPKFYRTKKAASLNEALIYSLTPTTTAHTHTTRGTRWTASACRTLARTRKIHAGRSRIPLSTALNTIVEVVERDDPFSASHTTDDQFGLQNLSLVVKEESEEQKANDLLPAVTPSYEEELCSRMHELPMNGNEMFDENRVVAELEHGMESCTL